MLNILVNLYFTISGIFAFQSILFGIRLFRLKDYNLKWPFLFTITASFHSLLFGLVFSSSTETVSFFATIIYIVGLFSFGTYLQNLKLFYGLNLKFVKYGVNSLFLAGFLLTCIGVISALIPGLELFTILKSPVYISMIDYESFILPGPIMVFFSGYSRVISLSILIFIFLKGRLYRDKWLQTGIFISIAIMLHNFVSLIWFMDYFIPLFPFMNIIELSRFSWLILNNEKTALISYQDQVHSLENHLEKHSGLKEIGINTASIIHDLAGPIFIIKAQLQNAFKELESQDSSKLPQRLNKILNASERLENMITDEKKDKLSFQTLKIIDFNPVLDEALEVLEKRLLKSNINVTNKIEGSDIKVLANQASLLRIIINLLNNACDEVSKLEEPSRWITIDYELNHNTIIKFSNAGAPVPKDIQEKIFTPYFTTKSNSGGSGFGLNICKNMMEEMHGQIIYHSEAKTPEFHLVFGKE